MSEKQNQCSPAADYQKIEIECFIIFLFSFEMWLSVLMRENISVPNNLLPVCEWWWWWFSSSHLFNQAANSCMLSQRILYGCVCACLFHHWRHFIISGRRTGWGVMKNAPFKRNNNAEHVIHSMYIKYSVNIMISQVFGQFHSAHFAQCQQYSRFIRSRSHDVPILYYYYFFNDCQ